VLPPEATPANPIDLIASARDDRYEAAIRIAAADPNIDSLLIIFVSPIMIDARSVAVAIARALEGTDKPAIACFMGKVGQEEGLRVLASAGIPVYRFPETAAEAIAAMERCRRLRTVEEGKSVRFDAEPDRAASVIAGARGEGRRDLTLEESLQLMGAYGMPCAPCRVVGSAAEAIAFGIETGYPIVLKVVASELSHKTDAGGVRVDLRNGDEAGRAYGEMAAKLPRFGAGARILAQKMIRGGREVIFGVTHDSHYGPLAMFGLGGIYVEVLRDVAFKILPLTDTEADKMIRGIRGFPLLSGFRGEKPVDLEILKEMLLRVSQLVTTHEEIESVDVNPFIVTDSGCQSVHRHGQPGDLGGGGRPHTAPGMRARGSVLRIEVPRRRRE
jgi:acetyltransferase